MFRWFLMLKKLFVTRTYKRSADRSSLRGLREPAFIRRRRTTVKPQLEGLTERILPSASALNPMAVEPVHSVAAVSSYMASTMDQWTHLITTLQQDIGNAITALDRGIAQEVSSVQQQWDYLLGIRPTTANSSLNSAVSMAGSDSGSGRGNSSGSGSGKGTLTTTSNTPHQTLNPSTQQNGRGSGSGSSATTTHGIVSKSGATKVHPLTSGTGSSADTYIWSPHSGANSGSGSQTYNSLASNPENWLKDGATQDQYGTVPGNKTTDIAEFDPTYILISDPDITWDYAANFSTMEIVNGYAGEQTITSSIELTGVDAGNTSLSMDGNNSSELYVYFQNNGSYKADKDQTITNMTLTGFPNGQFIIAGGETKIAPSPGYSERTGVQIIISQGATLTDLGYNSLQFTNSGLAINVYGTMNVVFGTGTGLTLMDNNGYQNNYINVSEGTLNYLGAGGVTDTFTVPVYVRAGGTFHLGISKYATNDGGKLIVKNLSGYTFPNGLKNSVYMAGATSSVQLALGDTLEADNDYYQADGALKTVDASTCTLQDGGTATIAGGFLIINQPNTGYGELDVNAQTLQFNGQLSVAINAANNAPAPTSDLLKVSGTTNLQAGSTLTVYVQNGPPANGSKWIIIKDNGGNITGDFVKPITTTPATNLNAGVDQKDKTQYALSF